LIYVNDKFDHLNQSADKQTYSFAPD